MRSLGKKTCISVKTQNCIDFAYFVLLKYFVCENLNINKH